MINSWPFTTPIKTIHNCSIHVIDLVCKGHPIYHDHGNTVSVRIKVYATGGLPDCSDISIAGT